MDDSRYPERITVRLPRKDAALLRSIARQEMTNVSSLTRHGLMLLVKEKHQLNAIAQAAVKRGQTYPLDV
ncbi:hypothetical protein H6F89_25065 [Cyanobacteria bacterium FACHB-63]|nr:hypothetical protein [Cyanobacteria bacterium FACHB-63]